VAFLDDEAPSASTSSPLRFEEVAFFEMLDLVLVGAESVFSRLIPLHDLK